MSPAASLTLDSPVTAIKGVGPKYRDIFHKNGISSVLDLLLHFPISYIDSRNPESTIRLKEKRLYKLELVRFGLSRIYRRRLKILNADVLLGAIPAKLVFFNKPYLLDFFKTHREFYVYGAFQERNGHMEANSPLIFSGEEFASEPVTPLYLSVGGITSGMLKRVIAACFEMLQDHAEFLPDFIIRKFDFPSAHAALRGIHFPERCDWGAVNGLKNRFIFGEFFLFQLELQYTRALFQRERKRYYTIPENMDEALAGRLPFTLTEDQRNCRDFIADHMKRDVSMRMLLQGDVGSGKTAVLFIALWLAASSGFQGAFLAPTEILARQHFAKAQEFFPDYSVALLVGSTPARERTRILQDLLRGDIVLLFGTHALLHEKVVFKDLALAVIDEQHRFGVSQRAALYNKGGAVDLLIATATPIPRTLLMTLYSDVSAAVIKTKPAGRLPIITKIYGDDQRDGFYRWLKNEILLHGHKVFIIMPLVEDSEYFAELRSLESEENYFRQLFGDVGVGVVSGRLKGEEKDGIISAFAAGEFSVLAATTVIEVGIDITDATVIVVEHADRYGLAQLHQLRGRVGRGSKQSYCCLLASENMTESGKRRLKTIAATEDGFEIAEIDLKMRGGGILTGQDQAGFLDFRVGNLQDHWEIFLHARSGAARVINHRHMGNEYTSNCLGNVTEKLKNISFS